VLTEAVEDYLKTIFKLSGRGEPTATSVLAERLGVAPPTVSAMIKRLAGHGLLRRLSGHRVELTEHGMAHALDVVRRHRLIEEFLFRVLGVPWDEVHVEADALEHAVSDRLIERIDAYLGRPTHDPHGDPIPTADGEHVERWDLPLTRAQPGDRFEVARVSDRDGEILRYLGELGIRPGVVLRVGELAPFGGPLWVEVDAARQPLATSVAAVIHGRIG
jgi:DtxR family Mn-dependent transcriptional regulator